MKKILILRTEHIGDYIVSLPAIKALKDKFPNSQIDVVVGPWNKELAEATPYVDKVIIFDNPLVQRNITYGTLLKIFLFKKKIFLDFYKKINKEPYDLLVSFSDRKFNKLFLPFIKAKKKISGVNFNFGGVYEKERCLKILGEMALQKADFKIDLKYPEKEKENLKTLIKKHNLKKKKILILHTFTPLYNKDWNSDKWAKLITTLTEKNKGLQLVIVGTNKEEARVTDLIKKANNPEAVTNLAGKTSVLGLFLLIKESSFFVGACSGPLYIADLFNKPTVALFGPESGKKWEPIREKCISLRKENIKNIEIDEVLQACNKIGLKI